MAFAKIAALSHPISALADRVTGQAEYVKGYFDGNAIQLKDALNAVIDELLSTSAAAQIGCAPITGVTGSSVQQMLGSIKSQLNGVVLGQIPDGTVTAAKLASDVDAQAVGAVPTTRKINGVALSSDVTLFTYGTGDPAGGSDGDVYFQYEQ